ncbi:DUF2267 domain-containing protein [Halarchaeum sp. P4]|uniref:DUF2267 domain-containing protein n=1 Tax=Halarchaeum sp. P4 TaxID=3421639 RepID=UPI003EBE253D
MTVFVDIVERRGGLNTPSEAEETAEAVLRTLSENLSHGEAADLAQPLPDRFGRVLLETDQGEDAPMSLPVFFRTVAKRLDVEESEAESRTQAVVAALADIVGADEVEDAAAQFPPEYEVVFAPGEALGALSFVEAVESRGEIDRETARRASRAVLGVFGERLSAGEAEDVAEYLPAEAAAWLTPPEATPARDYDFDDLVGRVADRESVSRERALTHLETVTDVLAETVGEDEFERMRAQLPETYDPLFE